ncbi:Phytocyanin domain [Dillenia turbinata]|uniref:Phytocyanin domain n=1 Tax=Dillenia turbinata TaxID=194707 RepID=A0AAN8VMU7_9MAGN
MERASPNGVVGVMLLMILVSFGGKRVEAEVHHVVGGDRGWDLSSDVLGWCSSRIFRVGDKIWFAYSAAYESIVEVGSREEYEACDISNPIRMFSDGLDSVSLEKEGFRYFTSGKEESCKNGLKIPVEVQPKPEEPKIDMVTSVATSESAALALAEGPTSASPRSSIGLNMSPIVAMLVCLLGTIYVGM